MGLFSHRKTSVSTESRKAIEQAVDACRFESLESRQLLSLMIDLRLPGGGKSANITGTDQTVNMELWAVVSGSNGDGSDDGVALVAGSVVSSKGGAALGNLTASRTSAFGSAGSSNGDVVDLDDDGDKDVGSNDGDNAEGFFVARHAGSFNYDGNVSGASNAIKIGTVTFRVTQLLGTGDVKVNFVPRDSNFAAVWAEDGNMMSTDMDGTSFVAGSPVVLKRSTTGGGGGTPTVDASVSSGVLTVKGTSGNNNIKLTLSGSNLVANVDGKTKSFAASSVNKIKLFGLDGNDVITVGAGVKATRLDGGNGNDSLVGGSLNDSLFAGAGRDTLKGGAGNDFLDGGTGPDVIYGGSGRDRASYTVRTKAVFVSIDEKANDGESGEGDNVRYDVEDIYGGSGNDVLRGDSDNNLLRGYDGRDTLYGGKGNDSLTGGNHVDKLVGEDGDDKFYAKDGAIDSLYGGLGNDRVQADKNDIRKDIEGILA